MAQSAKPPDLDSSGQPVVDKSMWDKRADGSTKGTGFLGMLKRPDGRESSEISIGVEMDGKEVEIPTLVPTLTKDEINTLLTMDLGKGGIPRPIIDKAVAFARQRRAAGKPYFADDSESPRAQSQRPPDLDASGNAVVPRGTSQPDKDGFVPLGSVSPEVDAKLRAETPKQYSDRIMAGYDDTARAALAETVEHPIRRAAEIVGPSLLGPAARLAVKAIPTGAAGKVVSMAAHKGSSMLLRSLGVPKPIAEAAIALAKRQMGTAATVAEESGPDVAEGMSQAGKDALSAKVAQGMSSAGKAPAPPVAAPSPAAPPVAPPAPVVSPAAASKALSPQRLANELGLAAKRANADFNADQYAAAEALVGQGLTPVQAVLKIKSAAKSVNAAADLARLLGTPTDEAMQAQIAARQYKN